jgi:tetratricopeptide (TPR) repeat protein
MRATVSGFTWMKALSTVATTALALAVGCGGDGDGTIAKVVPVAPVVQPVLPPVVEPPIVDPIVEIGQVQPAPVATLDLPATYQERVELAKQLARQGKHDDAITMYEGALALEPHAAPMIELARIALTRGDSKLARKHVEAALELAPESSGGWNTLGRVELMEGDLREAVTAFSRATELNESNGYAWNNLGLTFLQLRDYESAVHALERATASADVETYMWNNLGVAYEHLEQLDMARAAYEQAARKGSPVAKNAIARLDDMLAV